MIPGSLVTTDFMIYLDPVEVQENEFGESSWSNITVYNIHDIPFRPGEVGLVLSSRNTSIVNRTNWVTVLTPSGMGLCFSDELKELK